MVATLVVMKEEGVVVPLVMVVPPVMVVMVVIGEEGEGETKMARERMRTKEKTRRQKQWLSFSTCSTMVSGSCMSCGVPTPPSLPSLTQVCWVM